MILEVLLGVGILAFVVFTIGIGIQKELASIAEYLKSREYSAACVKEHLAGIRSELRYRHLYEGLQTSYENLTKKLDILEELEEKARNDYFAEQGKVAELEEKLEASKKKGRR